MEATFNLTPYYNGNILESPRTINAIYSDSLSIAGERDSEERYYREKLNGSISVVNEDFDWILSFSPEVKFVVQVSWIRVFKCSFYITDCDIDYDSRTLTISMNSEDGYTDVLNGLSYEYNVPDIAAGIVVSSFRIRAMTQVWLKIDGVFSDKVTCVVRGMTWDVNVVNDPTSTSNSVLESKYGFRWVTIGDVTFYIRTVLGRQLDGAALPTDDILGPNTFYKYWTDSSITVTPHVSRLTQPLPTKYGIAENGEYFVRYTYSPPNGNLAYTIPIGRTEWDSRSFWLSDLVEFSTDNIPAYNAEFIVKHNYNIGNIISAILAEIAPNISHQCTVEYSQFLYGVNPLIGKDVAFLMTPRSNLLKRDYDSPATKATTTLDEIFSILRTVYQCYWYIDDNKLKIEHISYFKNGLSYDGSNTPAVDLSSLYNPQTLTSWDTLTSNVKYDVSKLPSRYEFKWSEEVTSAFEGYPIEVLSGYVNSGQKEDVVVPNTISDIDYMIGSYNSVSDNGWVLSVHDITRFPNRNVTYLNHAIAPDGSIVSNDEFDVYSFLIRVAEIPERLYVNASAAPGMAFYLVTRLFQFDPATAINNTDDTISLSNMSVGFSRDMDQYLYVSVKKGTEFEYPIMSMTCAFGRIEFPELRQSLNVQNPYASFTYCVPTFYTYDLPSKNVIINGHDLNISDEPDFIYSGVVTSEFQEISYYDVDLDSDYVARGNVYALVQSQTGIYQPINHGSIREDNNYTLEFTPAFRAATGNRILFYIGPTIYSPVGQEFTVMFYKAESTTGIDVHGTKRAKEQTITIPEFTDIDPYKLINTPIGAGEVKSYSINLSDESALITLTHEI